jgi:hypothetical protein
MDLYGIRDILTALDWSLKIVLVAVGAVLVVFGFLNRNMPRVGGKIGRRSANTLADPLPEGFSRVECRELTVYRAPAEPGRYATLKAYMRDGTQPQSGLVHIYHVAGCRTQIEISAAAPEYDRIGPAEALALLRELPDPRLVARLHLSDTPSFLDPWWRHVTGRSDIFHLGHANNFGNIVLYLPDRRNGRLIAMTLLHEWMHLLGFKRQWAVRRFERANTIEAVPAPPIEPMGQGRAKLLNYEAWAELGERLLGDDDALARQAALASPVHAMILWRQIEKILRKTPTRFASTRLGEFRARAAFMRLEVAQKARTARKSRRWWQR